MTTRSSFPDRFLWGAATSAYQIEGSPLADGAGPSIWDRFSHTPGAVRDADTGDVACDHYRRYEDDVALMRGLGLDAYRFSVSWSRVLPSGRGRVNQAGLDFYRRLVDRLLENDIEPFVTLYHWDLPAALDDEGGWLNPEVASWFAEYARILFRALGDRVRFWTTLNEPWVVADGGYLHGALAPGHRNLFEAPRASHNLLRAHAEAVRAYRVESEGEIGLVVNLVPVTAASDRPEDLAAARRVDAYINEHYLDPVFLGGYPQELREIFGRAWPEAAEAEADGIAEPIDFVGVNYYTRRVVRDAPELPPLGAAEVKDRGRATYTETDWEVYPEGLSDTLRWVTDRYDAPPIFITENGAAFYDPPLARSRVDDPLRVDYLRAHLQTVRKVLERGEADLRGYFVWSLLDNFEWSHGYSKRFGICHVDFRTQRRTPKASADFYRDVVRSRGATLGGEPGVVVAKASGGAPRARR